MNVLVTGGAGFIGSHVVQGIKTFVLDNFHTGNELLDVSLFANLKCKMFS